MERATPKTVYDALDTLKIGYHSLTHAPVFTMEDCKAPAEKLGAPFCKNLFLQNRQGTEYFLLLIREDKRFRTAEVSKKIGRARLSFGNDAKLYDLIGVIPGAISPMGLIFDKDHEVVLLIDRDLLKEQKLCFHALVNTESLAMNMTDFTGRFLEFTGHKPMFLDIEG